MTLIISILILGAIILVHELGHFVTARFFSMPISEFSIGMGPQVYSIETKNTTYSFRAIPLGGYVNIEGMEIDSDVENGFATKPAYQRFIVLSAGVFMNFLLALFLLTSLHFSMGEGVVQKGTTIGKIMEDTPASVYLEEGDIIRMIDGEKIVDWEDIHKSIETKGKIEITVERKGLEETFQVSLFHENGKSYLGIIPKVLHKDLSFSESILKAGKSFANIISNMAKGLYSMIRGKMKLEEISGPIGILQVVGEASKQGIVSVLWLSVFLSINVGLLNLLPLPALDGGRILFVVLECLHIPTNKKIEEKIHRIGFALLLAFIFFISIQDILHLF